MQNNSDIKKFLADLNMSDVLNVEEDLGNGFVRLKISEAERRQALQDINCVEDIIVELLRNSRDADAKNIFIGTKKQERVLSKNLRQIANSYKTQTKGCSFVLRAIHTKK